MKIFALTDLGRKIVKKRGDDGSPEMRILTFIKGNNNNATDSELDIVAKEDTWMVRDLKSRGLIQELTT